MEDMKVISVGGCYVRTAPDSSKNNVDEYLVQNEIIKAESLSPSWWKVEYSNMGIKKIGYVAKHCLGEVSESRSPATKGFEFSKEQLLIPLAIGAGYYFLRK